MINDKSLMIIILLMVFIIVLAGMGLLADAELSDETKELVEDLRWKHYPFYMMDDSDDWTWEQSYPYIKFEDGILYIVDEDVTWFIEMEKLD